MRSVVVYHCDGCNRELSLREILWRQPHTRRGRELASGNWRFCGRCAMLHDNGLNREDDRADWSDALLPDDDEIPF